MGLRKTTTVRAAPVSFIGYAPNAGFPEETVWPLPIDGNLASNGTVPLINTDFLTPFVVPQTLVIDRLGFYVGGAGAAGSLTRIGLYRGNRPTLKPTSLLVDAGDVVTTGAAGVRLAAVNVTLIAGELYFYCCNTNVAATPTTKLVSGGGATAHSLHLGVVVAGFFARQGWSAARAFGPLLNDLTAVAMVTAQSIPMGWIRVSGVA